jgi:PAS domain S-box-containing protein
MSSLSSGSNFDRQAALKTSNAVGAESKVGKRLLVATLFATFLVCTVMLIVQNSIEKRYRQTISNTLVTILEDVQAGVHLWFSERQDDAEIWASHPEVVADAKALLRLPFQKKYLINSNAQANLRKLLEPVLEARGYQGFFIISKNFINLASTRDGNIGVQTLLSSQSYFIEKVLLGNRAISLPQFSDVPLPDETGKLVNNRPTMFVGAPIVDEEDEVIALLAFRIDPFRVFSKIIQRGRVGKTGETYAFNSDGVLLNHSRFEDQLREIGLIANNQDSVLNVHIRDHGRALTKGFSWKIDPGAMPFTKMADSAVSGNDGINIEGYRDYRGAEVVGAWRWMGSLGFGLATEQDYSEAYEPLSNFRNLTAGTTLFIVLMVGGLAFILQISGRRTAESARRYRAVFDHVVDGLITIDERGRVESMNSAAEKIFGFGSGEVIGKNVKMLMPEQFAVNHDGYLSKYMRTGRGGIIGQSRELEGMRKNGQIFPLDLGVSEIQLNNRRIFLGAVRDISERKMAEAELKVSEASLANAQNIAQLGSWRRDLKIDRQIWSDQMYKILGHEPQEFPASYEVYLQHVHPDDVQAMKLAVEKSEEKGTSYHIEHRLVRSDGTVCHVLEMGGATYDENGEVDFLSGIIQDITERKKVDRMKSEFVSTVSHELRTPLTSIYGSLGLLVGGAAGEITGQAGSLLEIAHKSSDRLIRLINDILDSEKLEANRMSFNLEYRDVTDLVEKAITANAAYAEQYDVEYVLVKRIDNAEVLADIDRFEQIMANLMSNAAKFSPKGGRVELSLKRHEGSVVVSVTDYGQGIPEEFHDRLFEKFAQADSSDTRKKGGTGLGLSIFKQLVERMGGEVGFESDQGVGTTFFFSLREHGRDKPEFEAENISEDEPKILICEDDPDIAHLLHLMLKQEGISCDIAFSAADATRMLSERKYICMTLDLMLPDKDGITLLREIRSKEKTKDLPVIVVSARAEEGKEELNGDAFGIIDWLTKPLDPEKLKKAVESAVITNQTHKAKILHVEDDRDVIEVISVMLRDVADIVGATTLAKAKKQIEANDFDMIILDIQLPDGSGVELLPLLNNRDGRSIPVLVFSAGDVSSEISQEVTATLVKSKTSNDKLIDTIKALIPPRSIVNE